MQYTHIYILFISIRINNDVLDYKFMLFFDLILYTVRDLQPYISILSIPYHGLPLSLFYTPSYIYLQNVSFFTSLTFYPLPSLSQFHFFFLGF